MTKAELIDQIHLHLASNVKTKHIHEKATVGHVLNALGMVAASVLFEGEEVTLPGLGKLEAETRKARKGRNPRTGAEIDIPARMGVSFRPGKALRDALNQNS